MSGLIASATIERVVGLETIPHLTPRDASIAGLESMLLGAHAEGIRNILSVTGDPPEAGDYPGAGGVYEVDSIGLAQVITRMNELRWGLSPNSIYWPIVDQSFFPDAASIQAVNQDVTAPWTANATTRTAGRFVKNGAQRKAHPLKTPLDGVLAVAVQSTVGRYTVSLIINGRQVAAGRGFSRTICGGRSAALVVHRKGLPGRYSLNVSRP